MTKFLLGLELWADGAIGLATALWLDITGLTSGDALVAVTFGLLSLIGWAAFVVTVAIIGGLILQE